ncbi:MAG: hypothetical protein IPJ65_11050 [Archangiaceae bacterium]|nr:hypothetical protein [Archangiaceae bacterium]
MGKTYALRYLNLNVTARLEDQLEVKMGLRTQRVPVEAVRFVYVAAQGNYQELVVAYDKPDGKRGILRAYANAGDPQFKLLADDLAGLRAGADLRALPRADAFKQMGARDTQRVMMVVMPVVVMAVLCIAMAPFIIHAFDSGAQTVNAEELGKVKLTTSNLTLRGELDLERYLEVTRTKNGVKTSASFQIPVYPRGAPEGSYVPVVLKTNEMITFALDRLAAQGEWKCTLRNVLWEGVAGADRDFMRDTLHLNVDGQTLLCELDDGKNLSPLALIGIVLVSGLFVSGIIVLAVMMQRRKQR